VDQNRPEKPEGTEAIRLDASTIEAIACRVAELVASGRDRSGDLLTVSEVAEHLGVSRAWVYENADQLGVIRLGGGKRPRLRFDSKALREQLHQRRSDRRSEPMPARPRRWLDEGDLIPVRGL
jgi:predicted DNA-binding transcriptional regulator AlpA